MSVRSGSTNKLRNSLVAKPGAYVPPVVFGLDGNLVALSTMNFFLNAAVSVITPFYPPAALSKGVSQAMIGFIFALNPIGSFSVSLTIGQMMGKLGKQNLMLYGLIIQSITIITFGVIYYVNDATTFIIISMVTRFMQGASRSAYGAATFGYVPQLWPTTVQKKIGIMETMTAIGLVLGPMIGSILHNLAGSDAALGYQLPFYVLSGVFIMCIFTIRWLPPDVKNSVMLDKVKAVDCLTDKGVFWTFMLMVGSAIANCYLNPQYTAHMLLLGLDENVSGYVVSIGAFFYMVFLHLMPSISKRLDKKFIVTLGTFISIVGVLVQGPEKYFGLPEGGGDTWYYVTIGQCINGVGSAMVILPMIPELIELIVKNQMIARKIAVPDAKLIRACSDMGSSIFVGGYALGTFIGPFVGGLLYENLPGNPLDNFMNESRIFALVIFVIMISYLVLGNGYLGFAASAKKMNWFQPKRALTQQPESVIARRAQSNINRSMDKDTSTPTDIVSHQGMVSKESRGQSITPQLQFEQSHDINNSDKSDELLSDHSENDEVLSNGSDADDIAANPRLPSVMMRKPTAKPENLFIYE